MCEMIFLFWKCLCKELAFFPGEMEDRCKQNAWLVLGKDKKGTKILSWHNLQHHWIFPKELQQPKKPKTKTTKKPNCKLQKSNVGCDIV